MADIVQPFVAVSGLAVGITATTVISDSASIPVAVSSFNGLTGAVTGVASFNGLTGAVTGVTTSVANTFTALQTFNTGITASGATFTGNVVMTSTSSHTGLATFSGGITAAGGVTFAGNVAMTSTSSHTGLATFSGGITASGLTLTGQFNVTNNSPDIDLVLTSTDSYGSTSWIANSAFVHYRGSNAKWIHPFNVTTSAATAATMSTTQVQYFGFVIYSTVNTKVGIGSTATTPVSPGTCAVKVYKPSRTTGLPAGAPIGDYGTITITATSSTMFTSSLGVTLSPGFYWIALGAGSLATTNMRRPTIDTVAGNLARTVGFASPAGAISYQVCWAENSGVTLPPATVGSLTEGTNAGVVCPLLLIV
jgi:fibronectin-binding autotransporter adhesin